MALTTKAQPIGAAKASSPRKNMDLNKAQTPLVIGGLIAGSILLSYLIATENAIQPLLLVIGLLLGYTLFHARFGFTSAFLRIMSVGNGQALRSHMLMLAVAVTLFAPILAYGYYFLGKAFLVMYPQSASVY